MKFRFLHHQTRVRAAKDHGKKFRSKLTGSFIDSEHIVNIW